MTCAQGGSDGIQPQLVDYQGAFNVVRREVDLFNRLVLPREQLQNDTDRAALWAPASARCTADGPALAVDRHQRQGWRHRRTDRCCQRLRCGPIGRASQSPIRSPVRSQFREHRLSLFARSPDSADDRGELLYRGLQFVASSRRTIACGRKSVLRQARL